jgi:predicted nuclease of predicted toxin-antitoxin system
MMNDLALRFLADESCDFAIVRALRAEGYDVLAVSEIMHRSDDRELIELASREKRILMTEDKDFGWLVFVSHADSAGVILIRFPGNARRTLAQTVKQLVQEQGKRLLGAFVVMQPGHIRISRMTGAETWEGV